MAKLVWGVVIGFQLFTQLTTAAPPYRTDNKYMVNGEYRGRFTPDADYVLSGESGIIVENLPSPGNAFTAAFWIRIDKPVDRGLLDNSWGSHPGARLRRYTPWVSYFRGSGNASCDLRKLGADKDQLMHIAMVYAPSKVELYVNGALRSWEPKTEVTRNAHVKDIRLFSGLESTVDEIRLYNKLLSETETAELAARSE